VEEEREGCERDGRDGRSGGEVMRGRRKRETGEKTYLKGGTLGLKFGCEDISLNSVSADSASPTLQHAFWMLACSRAERVDQ